MNHKQDYVLILDQQQLAARSVRVKPLYYYCYYTVYNYVWDCDIFPLRPLHLVHIVM